MEVKDDPITDRQLKYIHLLAEKNIDSDSMKNYLRKVLNKDSIEELTKKEASNLIEILKKTPGRNRACNLVRLVL